MNKRNIGSRQAEKLAREKFGKRTYVLRSGKHFEIGTRVSGFTWIKGSGKSWELALRAAGVEIPEDVKVTEKPEHVVLVGLTTRPPLPENIHLIGAPTHDIPDTMPEEAPPAPSYLGTPGNDGGVE